MIHLVLLSIFSYFLFGYPDGLSADESISYNILLISLLLILGSISFLKFRNRIDLFEPVTMVMFISIYLFVISPLIYLKSHYLSIDGVYMFRGCTEATILYTISYFCFLAGYYNKSYTKQKRLDNKLFVTSNKNYRNKILRISYWGWGICFALSLLFYVAARGLNLAYVLLFALVPNDPTVYLDTPLQFLINFSWSLIPFWLYIMFYSSNRKIKIILTIYTSVIFLLGGNRFIFIIMYGSYFVVMYMMQFKRPTVKFLSSVGLALILFVVILGYARNGIRSGDGFDFDSFNPGKELWTSFDTNSNIIMPFYCIVDKMPRIFSHSWGYGYFIEPLYYFLPRFLFPWKPSLETADIVMAMNNSTGYEICQTNGMATPSFSELYIEFGYIGCIIGMFLFGVLLRKIKKLYTNATANIHDLITYAILFTALFQVLIRGYMSMNVYLILFLIVPIYIIKSKIKNLKKYE